MQFISTLPRQRRFADFYHVHHHHHHQNYRHNKEINVHIHFLDGTDGHIFVSRHDTIYDIKLRIEKCWNIYHKLQTLIWHGYEIDDAFSIDELRIPAEHNQTVFCVMYDDTVQTPVHKLLIDEVIAVIDYGEKQQVQQVRAVTAAFEATSRIRGGSIKIDGIFQIKQNYTRNKQIFEGLLSLRKNKNERMLFHGTSMKIMRDIIENGFNRDFNKRHLYGKGCYFSNLANMAAGYSQQKADGEDEEILCMLVCRTYIGDSTLGKYAMSEDELYKPDKVTLYDSFVDDLANPSIFVVNRDYHAIPCFCVVFSIHDE